MKKLLLSILILSLFLIPISAHAVGGVPKSEHDALVALYNATNGANWWQNSNWNTEQNVANWHGVTVQNGFVTALNLPLNNLSGTIPVELEELTHLKALNLYGNQLSGSIPLQLGEMVNLREMVLADNQLSGSIPSSLNQLSQLLLLNLADNQLSEVEGDLSGLSNIQSFNLGGNQLTFADLEKANIGVSNYSPQAFIYNSQVEEGNNVTLTVPESASGESFQWYKNNVKINEETNHLITVPKSEADEYTCKVTHSNFPDLTLVSVNASQIIGGILKSERDALMALYNATDGSNWVQNSSWGTEQDVAQWYGVTVESGYVTELTLNYNQLSGTIPPDLNSLTHLQLLYLYDNQISGNIPSELGDLINLKKLSLNNNQISGTIPTELSNLNHLTHLHLGNNQLTGVVPSQLNQLIKLESLDLANNQLSGIEGDLSTLANVYSFKLERNQLTFSELEKANRTISSYSPQAFIYNSQLASDINITLTVDESAGGENFQWYKNNVKIDQETNKEITVPKAEVDGYYCKVTNSSFPDLTLKAISSINQIVGGVLKTDRDALMALYNATDGANWNQNTNWDTEQNVEQWYGVTVESGDVTALSLNFNQLSGTIPPEFCRLTHLKYLYLFGNQLSGSIPAEIGQMINLSELILADNQLSGNIPSELGQLLNLKELYSANNQLTGAVPSELNDLINLQYIDIANNKLSGVEGDLSNLLNVYWFDLCKNHLTFSDLETANLLIKSYSPQADVTTHQTENENNITFSISESVGGENYQWYKDEVKIEGKTSQELTVSKLDTGIYYCEIINSNFPALTLKSVEKEVTISTGMNVDTFFDINVSPNPFTNQLTISNTKCVVRVEITNLTDRRVFNQEYSGDTQIHINSSAFHTGLYLVSIYSSDGRKVVRKVIKK